MPCFDHNFGKELLDFDSRVMMLEEVFSGFDKVKICQIEKEIGGKSLMFNSVNALTEKYGYDFCLIIGTDVVDSECDDLIEPTQILVNEELVLSAADTTAGGQGAGGYVTDPTCYVRRYK